MNTRETKKQLGRWWKEIRCRGDVEDSRRKLDAGLGWSDRTLSGLEQTLTAVRAEYRDIWGRWYSWSAPEQLPLGPLYYQTWCGRSMAIGAWFFVILEGALSGILSILFLLVSPVWASVIGSTLAGFLAFALKGLVTPHFLAQHEETPKAARDLMLRWLAVIAPMEIALLALACTARNSVGALAMALGWLFGPVTGLLAVLTPVLASLLFVGAGLYSWSGRLSGEAHELEGLRRAIGALRECCLQSLAQLAAEPPNPKARTTTSGAVTIGALLLLGLGVCVTASAEDLGLICRDRTASIRVEEYAPALERIAEALPEVSACRGIREWGILDFDADAFSAPVNHLATLPPRFQAPPCAPPAYSEAARLFRGPREVEAQRAREVCDGLTQSRRQQYQAALGQAFTAIRTALAVPALRADTCTSFWDLLYRLSIMRASLTAVAVSDGQETCRQSLPPIPAPQGDSIVVLVLLSTRLPPGDRTTMAGQFIKHREHLLRVAPWLVVVPPWAFDASLFKPGRQIADSAQSR